MSCSPVCTTGGPTTPGELPGGVLAFEFGVICADEMTLLLPEPKEVTDRER